MEESFPELSFLLRKRISFSEINNLTYEEVMIWYDELFISSVNKSREFESQTKESSTEKNPLKMNEENKKSLIPEGLQHLEWKGEPIIKFEDLGQYFPRKTMKLVDHFQK